MGSWDIGLCLDEVMGIRGVCFGSDYHLRRRNALHGDAGMLDDYAISVQVESRVL